MEYSPADRIIYFGRGNPPAFVANDTLAGAVETLQLRRPDDCAKVESPETLASMLAGLMLSVEPGADYLVLRRWVSRHLQECQLV